MSEPRQSEPNSELKAASLTARVARGAAWILGAGVAARVLGALNTIIVARLLAPEDIGIVATATITMQLLQGISDIGVSQAVVKFRDADRDDLDTLFTFSVLRGVLIGALLLAAAPLAADFYGDPRLFWAFAGVAAYPLISGCLNPRFYEFERELKFSREFAVTILSRLAGVAVSIAVAVAFRTYWAIIGGLLAGGIVQLALSYALRPHTPRFGFKSINKVFGFSSWLAGVSFMAALNNKLDVPILTRLTGASGSGSYFLGLQLSEIVAGQIAAPVTRAIYPGLSELQGDPARMRRAFLRGVEALGAFAMPAAFGLAFTATDVTSLLLGEKWSGVSGVIALLAPVIGLQSLFYATQAYAIALGLTRLVFFRELVFFIVRMPVFIWAASAYGLNGAVIAVAGMGLFHVLLNLALYARASGKPIWEPLIAARRPIASVAAMSLWFVAVDPNATVFAQWPLFARLSVDVLAGATIYVLAMFVLWRVENRPDGIERETVKAASALSRRLARN